MTNGNRWQEIVDHLMAAMAELGQGERAQGKHSEIGMRIGKHRREVRETVAWAREALAAEHNAQHGIQHVRSAAATEPANYRHLGLWEAVTVPEFPVGLDRLTLDRFTGPGGQLIEVVTSERQGCGGVMAFVADGRTTATVLAAGPEDAVRVFLFPKQGETPQEAT